MDIGAIVDNANIAITGGTGTLGQALVREILGKYQPAKIVIFSRSESRQAAMKTTWPENGGPLRYLIGDVRDASRLRDALEGANIVIHAAALKRVEVCEREPKEAVLTNVLGTLNAAEAAKLCGVERFLFISSDKACAAATLYGGTKYVAERLAIGMNVYRGPRGIRYSAVRYGNVLGSTGSVVHSFQAADNSVDITHPEMSRFWLTPQTAAKFVLSSLAIMRGGETFVPKLRAMRISEMAGILAPQAEQKIVGIRGAEKIAECMLSQDESRWVVELPDRYVLLPAKPSWSGCSYPEVASVPAGWSYSSDTAEKMSEQDLKELLGV